MLRSHNLYFVSTKLYELGFVPRVDFGAKDFCLKRRDVIRLDGARPFVAVFLLMSGEAFVRQCYSCPPRISLGSEYSRPTMHFEIGDDKAL